LAARSQSEGRNSETALRSALTQALAAITETLDTYTVVHADLAKRRPEVARGGSDLETAVWELMGRCLSLSRALSFLLRQHFIVQSDVVLRALWETSSVLAAIVGPEERDLRERWLADQDIPYAATARAMERLERQFKETYGFLPPGEAMRASWERVYRLLSPGTHARRSAISRSNLTSGFAYNRESTRLDEAITVLLSTGLFSIVASGFDRALSHVLGSDWLPDNTTQQSSKNLLRAIGTIAKELRALDVDSLRSEVKKPFPDRSE
jgi:hypothetical protein